PLPDRAGERGRRTEPSVRPNLIQPRCSSCVCMNEREPREQLPRPPGPTPPFGAPRPGLNRSRQPTPHAQRSHPPADNPRDAFAEGLPRVVFGRRRPDGTWPNSGGAMGGLGEKFWAPPAPGPASLSVPLPLTPARMTPQLQLSYDSGAGNGVFGFGWSLE